jgi:hypothetical protein
MKPRSMSEWMAPPAWRAAGAAAHRPGAHLVLADGEEGDQRPSSSRVARRRGRPAARRGRGRRGTPAAPRAASREISSSIGALTTITWVDSPPDAERRRVGFATSVLADVEHHQQRLGGEELEAAQPPLVVRVEGRPCAAAVSASSAGSTLVDRSFVLALLLRRQAPLLRLLQPLDAAARPASMVGEHQLEVDRLDVARRVDRALRVRQLGVLEDAHHVHQRVDRRSLSRSTASAALAALDARDVDVAHRRRGELLGVEQVAQLLEPRVRHLGDPHVGLGRERLNLSVASCEPRSGC